MTLHRLSGAGLLALAAVGVHSLAPSATRWPAGVTPIDLLLIALIFMTTSAGLALLWTGAALTAPLSPPIPGCRCRLCGDLRRANE